VTEIPYITDAVRENGSIA